MRNKYPRVPYVLKVEQGELGSRVGVVPLRRVAVTASPGASCVLPFHYMTSDLLPGALVDSEMIDEGEGA